MKYLIVSLYVFFAFHTYSQEFKATFYSAEQVKDELSFFKQKLKSVHPKFNNQQFASEWDELYSSIKYELPDSVTINECYIIYCRLMSKLEDGHSNVLIPSEERIRYMNEGGLILPFTLEIRNNRIFVGKHFQEKESTNLSGFEILSIDENQSSDILKRLSVFSGAKYKSEIIQRYFHVYYWTIYGAFKHRTTIVLKQNDKLITKELPLITIKDYVQLRNKYSPANSTKYDLNTFDNQTAFMKIQTFAEVEALSTFLEKSFYDIRKNKYSRLIIDIRNNGGGTSRSVDTLISYLYSENYQQYKSIQLKISDEVKDKYKHRNPSLFAQIDSIDNGKLFTYPIDYLMKAVPQRESTYKGNIYLLINEGTFSGAATFAGFIKENKLGSLIGKSETGGNIGYYGDFLTFTMPHTEIKFNISPKYFIQFGGENLNKGVFADILLDTDTIKDINTISGYIDGLN
ncbi:MAG: S41 family peptidase [Bacteroidales bacterium]|nr:S41 family peptidase [Bacteroidales bacterium]